MQYQVNSSKDYINQLSEVRHLVIGKIREAIINNLPHGFKETMRYGMVGYVVPNSKYPEGYHCAPELSLTFLNIASKKNFVAVYHRVFMLKRKNNISTNKT